MFSGGIERDQWYELINRSIAFGQCFFCYNININNYPADSYLFKVNNRNTRTLCEICSKLAIKTPERRR